MRVARVECAVGNPVEAGALLVRLEPEESANAEDQKRLPRTQGFLAHPSKFLDRYTERRIADQSVRHAEILLTLSLQALRVCRNIRAIGSLIAL